jgi:ATP-dependent DNA helicase PIF1
MTGDFFQLPPIDKINTQSSKRSPIENTLEINSIPLYSSFLTRQTGSYSLGISGQVQDKTKYLFQSRSWLDLALNRMEIRELTAGFRQHDPLLTSILDDARFGVHSPELWKFLKSFHRVHHGWKGQAVEPTYLSGYRTSTDRYNNKKLLDLPGQVYSYASMDSVKLNEKSKWHTVPSPFELDHIFDCLSGAKVLNLKVGAQVILVRNIDVKNHLANGSRGVIVSFNATYDNLTERIQMLPVVQFGTGETYAVGYHDFETRLEIDGITIQRKQIPLMLGWALTVHRAQGMTLDRVIIDLPTAFAPGHAYVALSRVKSLQGLSIERFTEKSLLVSVKVQEFYKLFLSGIHH